MITKTHLDKLPFVSVRGVRYVVYEALRELLKEEKADDNSETGLARPGSQQGDQSEVSKRAK